MGSASQVRIFGFFLAPRKQDLKSERVITSWFVIHFHEESALWSNVIKGKYFGSQTGLDNFVAKQNFSIIWRGIVNSSSVLQQGIYNVVCNGRFMNFWGNGPLITAAVHQIPPELLRHSVALFWEGTSWNWNLLSFYLREEICLRLESVSLINDANALDCLA
ncbi:hypothetical protein GH714_036324 [Hevea brasiliensis]|uniref:Uncharacterized protein n=1 Tax=Hevea brasiliensis TaxID=3981 RepID=A0A6A6M4E0_HEVBR|nr:hypothetical protein GH714_036324 [Hevea brasiliensis]